MASVEAANSNWVDQLPWIMLGLTVTVKEDLGASSAEMVYGQTLVVPGDLIQTDTSSPQIPASMHLQDLQRRVLDLKPVPISAHVVKKGNVYVP